MKIDYHQRAYLANCARRRALELYQSAEQTKSDRQRVELQEEARYVEALAIDLDNGDDLQTSYSKTEADANTRQSVCAGYAHPLPGC